MAWLNATPEGDKKSRRESFQAGSGDSPFLLLPELNEAEYLIGYWHEAGTVSSSGMGLSPLSWQEIRAWRLENKLNLHPFELQAIRTLSQEYAGEYGQASEKDRPAPFARSEAEVFQAGKSMLKNLLQTSANTKKEPRYEVEVRE